MENKRFTKNDAGFICVNCGAEVPPLGYTSRDHCNVCLFSVHVDVFPGDREADCGGRLRPVGTSPHPRKGFEIAYKCEKCGREKKNMAARDDDMKKLIALTNPDNQIM